LKEEVRGGRERYVCTGISKRISAMGGEKMAENVRSIVEMMEGIDFR
jgi:hypothetical protein